MFNLASREVFNFHLEIGRGRGAAGSLKIVRVSMRISMPWGARSSLCRRRKVLRLPLLLRLSDQILRCLLHRHTAADHLFFEAQRMQLLPYHGWCGRFHVFLRFLLLLALQAVPGFPLSLFFDSCHKFHTAVLLFCQANLSSKKAAKGGIQIPHFPRGILSAPLRQLFMLVMLQAVRSCPKIFITAAFPFFFCKYKNAPEYRYSGTDSSNL